MTIGPVHCRTARNALKWTQKYLAKKSRVSESTIKRFEADRHIPHRHRIEQIEEALLKGGVIFIYAEEGVGGDGARLAWGVDPSAEEFPEELDDTSQAEPTPEAHGLSADDIEGMRAFWTEARLAQLSEIGRARLCNLLKMKELPQVEREIPSSNSEIH